jgi:hypothetical protein
MWRAWWKMSLVAVSRFFRLFKTLTLYLCIPLISYPKSIWLSLLDSLISKVYLYLAWLLSGLGLAGYLKSKIVGRKGEFSGPSICAPEPTTVCPGLRQCRRDCEEGWQKPTQIQYKVVQTILNCPNSPQCTLLRPCHTHTLLKAPTFRKLDSLTASNYTIKNRIVSCILKVKSYLYAILLI